MKKSKFIFLLLALVLSLFVFTSCDRDDDNSRQDPIMIGSNVTVVNTFQSTAFTMDAELPVEQLFNVPAGSLAATANVGNGIEFPAYLLNLYDIDISKNTIHFNVVAESNDPNYGSLFRILEPATFDRYYFTFDGAQNVRSFSSSNSSVNVRIDADNILVVEIGEGYDFNPTQSFTITLN